MTTYDPDMRLKLDIDFKGIVRYPGGLKELNSWIIIH